MALALALALCTAGGAARAADEPISLLKPPAAAGTGESLKVPAEEAKPARVGAPRKPAVEVDELEAIGADASGLDEVAGTALPRTLWQGSARAFIEALLARLPPAAPSPAMRRLAIALLAAPGKPPDGPGGGGAFLAARASALGALGEYQIAGALLAQAEGEAGQDPLRPRLESDLDFLAGAGHGRACAHARAEVRRSGEAYWQKALIFCQLEAGETEAARLGLDLLREAKAEDAPFLVLADALMGGTAKLDSLPDPTPLHFAMLCAARRPVPEDALEAANPASLRLIAASPETPMRLRLVAVEAAAAAGTVPAESVAKFYAAQEFKKAELADPAKASEKLPGARARALFYQAAAAAAEPEAKARLLAAGFMRARQDGVFPVYARAAFPLYAKLPIEGPLAWFAGDAARALVAASEPGLGARWHQLAAAVGRSDAKLRESAFLLWPVMTLAATDAPKPFEPALFEAWLEANGGLATPEAAARANLALALMQGVGIAVPDKAWQLLALDGQAEKVATPSPALMRALDEARDGGRVGETALLALMALGEAGPARAANLTLARVVASLHAVGLAQPARAIALEAALGKGL